MPKSIMVKRNTLRIKRGVLRGTGVVVLDRLHAKEVIRESVDHKEFKDETSGGSIMIAKTNRVGGLRSSKDKRSGASQGADLYNTENVVRPFGGSGIVPNNIKIPESLIKRKLNRNNIKLVL